MKGWISHQTFGSLGPFGSRNRFSWYFNWTALAGEVVLLSNFSVSVLCPVPVTPATLMRLPGLSAGVRASPKK
jgi:hypothetical protein